MNLKLLPFYFVLAGTILCSILLLAEYVNPTAAAALWSFPGMALPALVILWLETRKKDLIQDTNRDFIYFFFLNLLFFIVLKLLLDNTDYGVLKSIFLAFGIFIICAGITYLIVRKFVYNASFQIFK